MSRALTSAGLSLLGKQHLLTCAPRVPLCHVCLARVLCCRELLPNGSTLLVRFRTYRNLAATIMLPLEFDPP